MHLVLQRLLKNRLFIKAEKCAFHQSSIPFLGYINESGQIRVDLLKVQAVAEWPTPSTCKQLQRFLWFTIFYRRFIKDFSRVVALLNCLTSTKLAFS